jgi:DNA invertase Pin-like site-specific DNA recombinase
MRFIAYLRVSTDEQAESGAGLAAQSDVCRQHADRHGAPLVGPFADEGISGASGLDKRPQLLEAIAELSRGDVLLVAKRDRLGRDPIAVAMIEAAAKRKGARIVSAAGEGTDSDNPTDVLMRRIVDAFAEYERLLIGARTRAAMQAKIRRGHRCGAVRFGYDLAADGATLVENHQEQEIIRLIRDMRARGESSRAIAKELDRIGVPTKQGRAGWGYSSIERILARTV